MGRLLEGKIIEACEAWGFDSGLNAIRKIAQQWAGMIPGEDYKFRFQLIIAGISESAGPQHWYMQFPGQGEGIVPAFELTEVTGNIFAGINGTMGDFVNRPDLIRRPLSHETPPDYFRTMGAEILQMARKEKVISEFWEGSHCTVGGQVDLTLVTPAGVTVETIHRWNDKVGELIDPTKDRPASRVVAELAPMNRQQRRAAGGRAKVPRAA